MNAKRDENSIATMTGTLQSDGASIVNIAINPANNAIKVVNGTSGVASTRVNAALDENSVPVWMGVSSADGVTLVPIAVDSSGNLLIQST